MSYVDVYIHVHVYVTQILFYCNTSIVYSRQNSHTGPYHVVNTDALEFLETQ